MARPGCSLEVDSLNLVAHRENHAWSIEYSGLILDVVTGHYWVYSVKSREDLRPSRGPDTMASLEEHRQMSTEYELDVAHKQELARLLEGGVCQGNKSEHRAFDAGTLSVFAVWPDGSLLIGRVGDTRVAPYDEGQVRLFDLVGNLLRAHEGPGLSPIKHFQDAEQDDGPVMAWIPVLKSQDGRGALDAEKIGGTPGLPPGTKWPRLRGHGGEHSKLKPAVFVMQFRDPRPGKGHGKFMQLFVPQLDDIEGSGDEVLLREVDPESLVDPDTLSRMPHVDLYGPPRLIMSWKQAWETPDKVFEGEKLGGIGSSCQGEDYRHFVQNLFPGEWGDAGSLHISDDGHLFGDMC